MLSFRGRGIVAFLQANPEIPVNSSTLRNHGVEGYQAIRRVLNELVEHGLLRVSYDRVPSGRVMMRFHRTQRLYDYDHRA